MSGSVTDRTGAVVRAARVSLMNARDGVLATASTGGVSVRYSGRF